MVTLLAVTKKQAVRPSLFENQTGRGKCPDFRQGPVFVHCGPRAEPVQ